MSLTIFSERERESSRSLYVVVRPSVVRLTFVHPAQAIQIFGNFLYRKKDHLS